MLRLIRIALTIPWAIILLFLWLVNTFFLGFLWVWFLGVKPIPNKEDGGWANCCGHGFDYLDYKKRADGTLVRFAPWEWTLLALGTVAFIATLKQGINTASLIVSAVPFLLVGLSWFIEAISRNWEQVQPRLTVKIKDK